MGNNRGHKMNINQGKRNERARGLFSDPRCHGMRSNLSVGEVMGRIKIATEDSPIIVYRGSDKSTYTTAFAATIRGAEDLARGYSRGGERVVGAWHRGHSDSMIRDILFWSEPAEGC